jgi:hypothetical protein
MLRMPQPIAVLCGQARSLNLQAYMNRAIVTNEVAIAQSVSLRSWSDYLKQTVQDINTVTPVRRSVAYCERKRLSEPTNVLLALKSWLWKRR